MDLEEERRIARALRNKTFRMPYLKPKKKKRVQRRGKRKKRGERNVIGSAKDAYFRSALWRRRVASKFASVKLCEVCGSSAPLFVHVLGHKPASYDLILICAECKKNEKHRIRTEA